MDAKTFQLELVTPGKLVYTGFIDGYNTQILLPESLSDGIYFIQYRSADFSESQRILLKSN